MSVSPENHPKNKPCTLCGTPQPVLVRCQIDESGDWHFVCPGKCWTSVSGGVQDAKGSPADYPHYRYGGMWKNKHAMVSAKKPKLKSGASRTRVDWSLGTEFTRNDLVDFHGAAYRCRRSHKSAEENEPGSAQAYRFWVDEEQSSGSQESDDGRDQDPAAK